jgi:hypothetical protein
MIMNRLIKMHHYISCTIEEDDTFKEETAKLLINHVWKLHELSSTIVSNRESQFICLVWKTICQTLKIKMKLSTAFHSETDDQNEIVNQEMKRYLRNYCNYQQNDWSEWLSMIEFAFNVAIFISIELFAFMTNYDFESRMSFDSSTDDQNSARKRILTRKDTNITDTMREIWDFTKQKLIQTQENQKHHADKKRNVSSEYVVEDEVWLFIKNIKTERSSRKLNHKWIESYKIKKVLKDACQLDLSQSMRIHDIFHTFLLRKIATNSLIEQIQTSSSSIVMNDEEEYKVNDILNSRYHYDKLQYRIAWIDHSLDRAWYSAENFEHFKNILENYHQRYSEKFDSTLRLIIIIETMLSQ